MSLPSNHLLTTMLAQVMYVCLVVSSVILRRLILLAIHQARMHSWGPVTYTVGSQAIGYFPMAAFKEVGAVTIRFALASAQGTPFYPQSIGDQRERRLTNLLLIGGARTLEIGTTLAFAGKFLLLCCRRWLRSCTRYRRTSSSDGEWLVWTGACGSISTKFQR